MYDFMSQMIESKGVMHARFSALVIMALDSVINLSKTYVFQGLSITGGGIWMRFQLKHQDLISCLSMPYMVKRA
jgi:hypothetical protein